MKFTKLGDTLHPADEEATLHLIQMQEGDEIGLEAKPRTSLQNASLWKYCTQMADALNAAGFDMRTFPFREGLTIPFTKNSVMELFWRPIQGAMFDKASTRRLTTKEVQEVYQAVDEALFKRAALRVDWPCQETQMQEGRRVA